MLASFAFLSLLSFVTATSQRVARRCGTCDQSQCEPLPTQGCKSGTVLDFCGCCSHCAAGEGESCGARGVPTSRCASGMECVKSGKKSKTGTCVCKTNFEVCGTDGVTYKTGCDLKAASLGALSKALPEIKVQNKGKCVHAPVIVTSPKEIWNVTGSQVSLTCEAIGIPTPVLTWKKVIVPGQGKAALLPGDRENLAVQTRGGPEKHEVTGWVLIMPLTESDGGSYECHAANAVGEASAMGAIHVVRSVADIPAETVNDDEL